MLCGRFLKQVGFEEIQDSAKNIWKDLHVGICKTRTLVWILCDVCTCVYGEIYIYIYVCTYIHTYRTYSNLAVLARDLHADKSPLEGWMTFSKNS